MRFLFREKARNFSRKIAPTTRLSTGKICTMSAGKVGVFQLIENLYQISMLLERPSTIRGISYRQFWQGKRDCPKRRRGMLRGSGVLTQHPCELRVVHSGR
jgi:hypothetical protein